MVRGTERAQLILIGALLVATVIFGLSFLLNSLLFAGASSAGGAGPAVADTQDLADEVERSVRSLVLRLNHQKRNVTAGDLAANIETNVTRFSRLLGEAKAAAGPVALSVTYDNATSTRGYRIVQAHDDDFRDGANSPGQWFPVPGGGIGVGTTPLAKVGWFTVNVNVQNTSTGTGFTATARNDSGDTVSLELRRNGANVSVTSDPPGPGSATTVCRGTDGRALVDMYDGSAFGGDCEFTGIGNLTGPMTIEFENPDQIEGRYAIVLNQSTMHVGTPVVHECLDGAGNGRPPAEADPCAAPVIWSANVTTSVRADQVTYRNAFNLSIYPGDR